MWTFKEILIFITGMQVFHAFSHFFMFYIGFPPFPYMSITITPMLIFWGGIINAIIAFLLLWWITKLK